MASMAAKQAPNPAARGGRTPAPDKCVQKKGLRERLHDLPQAAGAAIMVVLLVLALFVGNFRALQSATPKAFIRQGDVQSIIEDRIDAAENVLTIASRASLDADVINAAETSIKALEKAKTAREISRANQTLTGAISELSAAEGLGQDADYMRRAADEFAELGSFLRQEARAYNEKAEKAEALYERLPTKFMFKTPDVYEGL